MSITIVSIDIGPSNTGMTWLELSGEKQEKGGGFIPRQYGEPLEDYVDGIRQLIPSDATIVLIEKFQIRSMKKSGSADQYIALQSLLSDKIRESSPAEVMLVPERSWRSAWIRALQSYVELDDNGAPTGKNLLADYKFRGNVHVRDSWQMLLSFLHQSRPEKLKELLGGKA